MVLNGASFISFDLAGVTVMITVSFRGLYNDGV